MAFPPEASLQHTSGVLSDPAPRHPPGGRALTLLSRNRRYNPTGTFPHTLTPPRPPTAGAVPLAKPQLCLAGSSCPHPLTLLPSEIRNTSKSGPKSFYVETLIKAGQAAPHHSRAAEVRHAGTFTCFIMSILTLIAM